MPMRFPAPACKSSYTTKSSPSGPRPCRNASRLKGMAITHRAASRLGWHRDRVTVPITSAMRIAFHVLQDFGDLLQAFRRLAANRPQDLSQFEIREPWHLHRHQVWAELRNCSGSLGDGSSHYRSHTLDLVGDA